MKKKVFISIICFVILLGGYWFISTKINKNTIYSKINFDEVQFIIINKQEYSVTNDEKVIKKIISMYNEATILKNDGDTTPSHLIVIQLKNGREVIISGTTQGFHYVNDGEMSYKISSHPLSVYLRNSTNLK